MLPDAQNDTFNTAAAFISQTTHPVFLTGKAGTGKTTFLKHIRETTTKNVAVVAPTGVAAINAGGVTIHSFFQLPFSPFIPTNSGQGFQQNNQTVDKHSLIAKLKINNQRRDVMRELELLIIDEVSMVRCDVLDAMDLVLRHVRNAYHMPFGGVQVLYIGDMYQLPPVVKDQEWSLMSEYYKSPFFFASQAYLQQPPVCIELKKVYRQSDNTFIDLLNKVRNNEMEEDDFEALHRRYQPDILTENQTTITLTTHNAIAENINTSALLQIHEREHSFIAEINGDFFESAYPADEQLRLKVGAQVMFIKNDVGPMRKYFNGKIGTVKDFDEDKIIVTSNGTDIEVKKETWQNIQYALNRQKNEVEEEVIGTFKQYPLRLAWAITIHKSQGLTFDDVIIDAGKAFAPGQVYVALSRCTSLQGIILKSKVPSHGMFTDPRIVEFSNGQHSQSAQQQLLREAVVKYKQQSLIEIFRFYVLVKKQEAFTTYLSENLPNTDRQWINDIDRGMQTMNSTSEKFEIWLKQQFDEGIAPEQMPALTDRLPKAAAWFANTLNDFYNLLMKCPTVTDNRQLASDITNRMQLLADDLQLRQKQMELLKSATDYAALQQLRREKKQKISFNAYAGKSEFVPSGVKHGGLYVLLKHLRDEICSENDLPTYRVCNTDSLTFLSNHLPVTPRQLEQVKGFGKVKVKQFGKRFLDVIKDYVDEHDLFTDESAFSENATEKRITHRIDRPVKPEKIPSRILSYDLYKQGKTVEEIAAERNMAASTIEGHLSTFIKEGLLNINDFVPTELQQKIKETIEQHPEFTFSELKNHLPPEATYGQIRMVRETMEPEKENQ